MATPRMAGAQCWPEGVCRGDAAARVSLLSSSDTAEAEPTFNLVSQRARHLFASQRAGHANECGMAW
eukprot:590199-Rhodomonas_salina.1